MCKESEKMNTNVFFAKFLINCNAHLYVQGEKRMSTNIFFAKFLTNFKSTLPRARRTVSYK